MEKNDQSESLLGIKQRIKIERKSERSETIGIQKTHKQWKKGQEEHEHKKVREKEKNQPTSNQPATNQQPTSNRQEDNHQEGGEEQERRSKAA